LQVTNCGRGIRPHFVIAVTPIERTLLTKPTSNSFSDLRTICKAVPPCIQEGSDLTHSVNGTSSAHRKRGSRTDNAINNAYHLDLVVEEQT